MRSDQRARGSEIAEDKVARFDEFPALLHLHSDSHVMRILPCPVDEFRLLLVRLADFIAAEQILFEHIQSLLHITFLPSEDIIPQI